MLGDEDWEEMKVSVIRYLKIIALSLLFPMWISIVINEGAVLLKIVTWINQEVAFLSIREYVYWSTLIALIPLAYLAWFYFLTIKKILLQLHEDFFKTWYKELGKLLADSLIETKKNGESSKKDFNIDLIIMYVNKKLSKLPGFLEWIARKILDQIPYVELLNLYDVEELEKNNRNNLADSISNKLDEMTISKINAIIPFWTKLIIPINILFLLWYMNI